MTDEPAHRVMESEALRLWEQGALDDARAKYEAAIAACPRSHWAFGQYLSGLAGVLAVLGRHSDAREQCERAVQHALEFQGGDESAAVAVARYFLGTQCLRQSAFAGALAAVTPSIAAGSEAQAHLRTVQAHALVGLGRTADARIAAKAAFAAASSDDLRMKVTAELRALLEPGE